jgi:hypothetical protein
MSRSKMKTNGGIATLEHPEVDIVSAVDRLVKIEMIRLKWKAVETEAEQLKSVLRDVAGGRTMDFPASDGTAFVRVEQKPDRVCRVVSVQLLPSVIRLAGEQWPRCFRLHPWSGDEGATSFKLNLFNLLSKAKAIALYEKLLEKATAFVSVFPFPKE